MSNDTYTGPDRRKRFEWDPSDTGAMTEDRWRREVVDQFSRFDAALTENTEVTRAGVEFARTAVDAVNDLRTKTTPMLEFSGKVQKGFEVVGWIGACAEWIVKKWFYVALLVVAGKLLMSGGTWQDVLKLWKDAP